ncbi:MAG: VCBS domain-containing protein [Rhabdaerophilum sp.]
MFKPFDSAEAALVAARHLTLAPPAGNQAIILQVNPGDTLDLTALGDRKITMVRLDHRLILLFEDKGHIVLEGALTPDGHPVGGIMTIPAEGQVLSLADMLGRLGPIHTAEIMTQAGIASPPAMGSALTVAPPADETGTAPRMALALLGDESLPDGASAGRSFRRGGHEGEGTKILPGEADDDAGSVSARHAAGRLPVDPGQPEARGNVLANDGPAGPGGAVLAVGVGPGMPAGGTGQVLAGTFGTLVLAADGTYRYTLDAMDPDTIRLGAGETAQEVFTYLMQDAAGQQATASLTITVTGGNDGPSVLQGGAAQFSESIAPVVEDPGRITGTMVGADPDRADVLTFSGGGAGQFGDLVMEASGQWTYTPRDGALDVLQPGETRTETFSILLTDVAGVEARQDLVITITGADDLLVIDLDSRDATTNDYLGYRDIEAAISDPAANPFNGREIIQIASNGNVPHVALTDADGGALPLRLVVDLAATQTGNAGFLQVDPQVLALFGATVTGDGTGRIVFETGVPLAFDQMQQLLAAIRYFNTEATFALDVADREITVSVEDDQGRVASSTAFVPVIAYVEDVADLGAFTGTRFGDWIIGHNGDTRVAGQGGDDFIITGDGNDQVDGGDGIDTIETGDGDDIIHGGAGNDFIETGEGFDQVWGGDGDDYINTRFGPKYIDGGNGNDEIIGDDADDILIGGAGNDFLLGYLGNDQIEGGDEEDTVLAGGGDDRVWGGTGDDRLDGGSGNDILRGEAGNDDLEGGRGDDELVGGEGDDSLAGGRGTDRIDAGDGNDFVRININEGFDTVDGGAGTDSLLVESNQSSTRFAITLEGEHIRAITLHGTVSTQDVIVTDAQDNRNVSGIEAFELVQWAPLDGTLDFSTTRTDVTVDLDTQPRGNGTSGMATGFVEVYGFLHVTGGSGHDSLTGDAGDNILAGGAGEDILQGEAGNDTLRGGAGDDRIDAGDGDDTIIQGIGDGFDSRIDGGAGNDRMIVESDQDSTRFVVSLDGNGVLSGLLLESPALTQAVIGPDAQGNLNADGVESFALHHLGAEDGTLDFSGLTIAVNVDLDGPLFGNGKGTATGFSEVVGFQHVIGGDGDDTLWGDDRGNLLEGGAGNDYIVGFGGEDVIIGGDGHDMLFGSEGTDRIYGGAGNDILSGFEGDDILDGGEGSDRLLVQSGHNMLAGGSGADQFAFVISTIRFNPAANGNHIVADFNAGEGDRIHFSASSLLEPNAVGGASTGALDPNRFMAGTDFTNTDQRFLWNANDSTLYYDADGAGAAWGKVAVCRLLQGTLDSSMIHLE